MVDLNRELTEIKQKATPVNTAKFLIGTVVSMGAFAAVTALMKGSLSNSKGVAKLMMRLGIFILGCKAGDVAEEYFSERIESIIKAFNEAKEETKNESDSVK